jgi:D-glycero-D-manno-heptose 1,7-bisphosphate phosphatase
MKLLYIFDADGTLRRAVSNSIAPSSPDDWELLPGVAEWFREHSGIQWGIASNQGGVPRGYVSEADAWAALVSTADALGGLPDGAIRICTAAPGADDSRRKPNAGMLHEIMECFNVAPNETIYIGDRPEDEKAAVNAGVAFSWAHEFFGWEKEG